MENLKNNRPLRINSLLCQLDCKFPTIQENIDNIDQSLAKYKYEDKIDVIMFPEMAFSGYNFESKEDIIPKLEEQTKGQVFVFFKKLALKMGSHVIGGYAEKYIDEKRVFYLRLIKYGLKRDKDLKHLKCLIEMGFDLKQQWVKFVLAIKYLAICMDINPYEFRDNNLFEFGNFCKNEDIDVIFFISAWTDSEPTKNTAASIEGTINYWLWRLYPIVNRKNDKKYDKQVLFLVADRVGEELNATRKTSEFSKDDKTFFVGCSCCIKLNPVELIYNFDKKQQGILKSECTLETLI